MSSFWPWSKKAEPRTPGEYLLLGERQKSNGRFGEALKTFETATVMWPDFAEAWMKLGILYGEMRRTREALASFREVVRLQPEKPEGHHGMGLALGELGRVEEAVACFEEAIRLRPDFYEAWVNLGIELGNLRKAPEAVVALQKASSLRPNEPFPHFQLVLLHAVMGDKNSAVREYEILTRIDPQAAATLTRLLEEAVSKM